MPDEKIHAITESISTNLLNGEFHLSFVCRGGEIITLKMNDIQITEAIHILKKEQIRALIHQEHDIQVTI